MRNITYKADKMKQKIRIVITIKAFASVYEKDSSSQ